MQAPAWAVVDRELAGSVEAGGVVVAIWREAGHRTLLLEAVMPRKSRTSMRPVDSGTANINVARERASAFAEKLLTLDEAGIAGEERVQNTTYQELTRKLHRQGKDTSNRKAQLNAWRRIFGFGLEDAIGDELGAAFDVYLQSFRDRLEQEGKARSTINSYLSRMRDIRTVAAGMRDVDTEGLTFPAALDAAITASGMSLTKIAKEVGIHPSTLSNWRVGFRLPAGENYPKIAEIESFLGLRAGTLMDLLVPPKPEGSRAKSAFATALRAAIDAQDLSVLQFVNLIGVSYATVDNWLHGGSPGPNHRRGIIPKMEEVLHLSAGALIASLPPVRLTCLRYAVEFTDLQEAEWERLFNHKTGEDADEDRCPQRYWRVKKDRRCPSAKIIRGAVRRFYGCLTLPADAPDVRERGLGLDVGALSLLNLANRKQVEFYVKFLAQRAGGYNGETVNFINFVCSLLRPGTGFLYQGVEVDWRRFPPGDLEADATEPDATLTIERWRSHCISVRARLMKWVRRLEERNQIKPTRDYAHIEGILDLDRPAKVLVLLERRFRAYVAKRWHYAAPRERAILARDLLLICMINRNPLRLDQWEMMRWKKGPGVAGHLFKKPDGNYALRFSLEDFKAVARMRDEDYEADIDPALTPMINEYLTVHRPLLAGAETCNLVFRPARGRRGEHSSPLGIRPVVCDRTRRFVPEYAPRGFASHGWRHIIATDLVKNHPDGIKLAADALHNTEEMIEKHYGHLRSWDRTKRSHQIIAESLELGAKELDSEVD